MWEEGRFEFCPRCNLVCSIGKKDKIQDNIQGDSHILTVYNKREKAIRSLNIFSAVNCKTDRIYEKTVKIKIK
jgi:hypothetical protein